MKRQAIALLTMTWLMLGMVPATVGRAWAASEVASLKAISIAPHPAGQELILRVDGPYTYKTVQATPDALLIDVVGAQSSGVPARGVWADPVLAGYKLLPFTDASGRSVARIQVDTRRVERFVVLQDASTLRLLFGGVTPSATPTVKPVAAIPPAVRPTHAPPPVRAGGLVVVSSVTLDKHDSGETFVDVSTSRAATYRVSSLKSPARLVVDIDSAQNASRQTSYSADSPVLRAVRIGQFRGQDPAVVRVVADLNGDPAFDVHTTPAGLRIELRPRGITKSESPAAKTASTPPAVKAAVAVAPPAAPPHETATRVRPPDVPVVAVVSKPQAVKAAPTAPTVKPAVAVAPPAVPAQVAVARVHPATVPVLAVVPRPQVVKAAPTAPAVKPAVAVAVPVAPAHVAVARLNPPDVPVAADVPKPLAPPVASPEDTGKAETIVAVHSALPSAEISRQVSAAPLPPVASATPEALRAAKAAQILNPVTENPQQAPQTGVLGGLTSPPEPEKPVYTGEPISLNLKDVDLKDFFRLIHEISGLNIIVDPNVSGTLTVVLDSVPWDQALDIVLKDNRLGKTLEGNVLRIARIETLTAEQDGITKLAAARMDAAPLVTLFRPINYAKAAEIAAILKTWVGGGALSRRGTVLVDVRANTLIISDVQSQIPILESILNRMDRKAKQVSIEARVVLATANFSRTLAASLLGGYMNNSTVTTGVTGNNSNLTIPVPTVSQPRPITTATSATASGFGAASITNIGARYFINAAISAAEERDEAKTISRPTIVTQNNVLGMVQQGVQVPIQTSINNTISVQYVSATLQLSVTPQVTDDGNIFMIIAVQNSSVGASVTQAGPNINTQQATTQVLVPDGGTVIFGGITVTSRTHSATYIPLLGSIPVVGHLFKTSNAQDSDQELLFFVSPKILIT